MPPRPELAPALVPGSWTELVKVRPQNLPQRGSELPSASPALEQATPWPLLLAFWPVSVPQVRRLVPPSLQLGSELPSASPALGQERPWPLLLAFWSVSVSQVRRLVPPSRLRHSPSLRLELPLTQVGTSSNTLHRLATTETSIR